MIKLYWQVYLQPDEPAYSVYFVPYALLMHNVQLDTPETEEYLPISPGVQFEAPIVETYFPATRLAHVDDVFAPIFVEYFPVAHDVHCVAVAIDE